MYKFRITLVIFVTLWSCLRVHGNALDSLDIAIKNAPNYDQGYHDQTQSLYHADVSQLNLFEVHSSLFQKHMTYCYDSAWFHAQRSSEIAYQQGDIIKINQSRLNYCQILIYGGRFKEAFDSLSLIHTPYLTPEQSLTYYVLNTRAYFDLSDYHEDVFYSGIYNKQGALFADSVLLTAPEGTYAFQYFSALRLLREDQLYQAKKIYHSLLLQPISIHQKAGIHASLGYIYQQFNDLESAKYHLIQAAIHDIKGSIKEGLALQHLALLLFHEGEIEKAYEYIQIAYRNAQFYGTKFRTAQISEIMPIIEAKHMQLQVNRQNDLMTYIYGITLLGLLVSALLFIIIFQLKKIRRQKKSLIDSNEQLKQSNVQIQKANEIQEEYITYFFHNLSLQLEQKEAFKKEMSHLLVHQDLKGLQKLSTSLQPKKERDNLYQNFDQIFLSLFPHFVRDFNTLLKPDAHIQLKKDDQLTPELRIFALKKMGIHDQETIAHILNYSINTIYTYRTKIKNKSRYSLDEIDHKIILF